MARFQGKVTQEGWQVEFETSEADNQTSTILAQSLALTFIQTQTSLQVEGQKIIRQSFLEGNAPTDASDLNGQTEEAETLGKTREDVFPHDYD
jgi:hypothetical protein